MTTEYGAALADTLKIMRLTRAGFARYLGEPEHFKDTVSRWITRPRLAGADAVDKIARKIEADKRPEVAACGPRLRAAQASDAAKRGGEVGAKLAQPRALAVSARLLPAPSDLTPLWDKLDDARRAALKQVASDLVRGGPGVWYAPALERLAGAADGAERTARPLSPGA